MEKLKVILLVISVTLGPIFALERVNLIKSHDFESNVNAWTTETGVSAGFTSNAEVELQDTSVVKSGKYSALSDTPFAPDGVFNEVRDSAIIWQEFAVPKQLADLDSLVAFYYDSCNVDSLNHGTFSVDLLSRMETEKYLDMRYQLYYSYPFETPADLSWLKVVKAKVELNEWKDFSRDVYDDFHGTKNISADQVIHKIVLRCFGMQIENTWWGQKVYWDAIRLTGWADYDIGLTRISGDLKHPRAMVWNNGREGQTDIKVIATIEGTTPYADTVIVPSLASDDSTEVSFKEYSPGGGTYTMTVVTGGLAGMSPDECDEDDILTKEYSGIGESPSTPVLQLNITRNTPSSFLVSYSIPNSEQGMISLYDPSGRRIESLTVKGSGSVSMKSGLATGVYFIRLETGHSSMVRKAVVLD